MYDIMLDMFDMSVNFQVAIQFQSHQSISNSGRDKLAWASENPDGTNNDNKTVPNPNDHKDFIVDHIQKQQGYLAYQGSAECIQL